MAVATDALNVRRGIMRTGSSAKVLGFCGFGGWGGGGGGGSCCDLGLLGA